METKSFPDLVRDVCSAFEKVEQSFIEFDIATTLMNVRASQLGIVDKSYTDKAEAAMKALRETLTTFEGYREQISTMREQADQFEELLK